MNTRDIFITSAICFLSACASKTTVETVQSANHPSYKIKNIEPLTSDIISGQANFPIQELANKKEVKKGFSGHFLGKRYEVVITEPLSWKEANTKAMEMGGELACFDTPKTYSYIQHLRSMNNNMTAAWVGLTDSEEEGKWKWTCNNTEIHPKIISYLNRREDLENRDFAHFSINNRTRTAFISRNNAGEKPEFIKSPKVDRLIRAFVVAFDEATPKVKLDDISQKYKRQSPKLYVQVEAIETIIQGWGGQSDLLTDAENQLNDILAIDDAFVPAIHQLAILKVAQGMVHSNYYRSSKLNEAKSYLYKALKLEPNYGLAYLTLANTLVKEKHYNEAKAALYNAVDKNVSELQLNASWGYLYEKQRKYRNARYYYNYIIQNHPDDKSTLYISALSGMNSVHISNHNYPEVISGYEQLMALKPESAWVRGNYASFLFYTYKDTDAAIEYAEKALAILDYGMARKLLADCYYTKWHSLKDIAGSEEEAKKYFDQAFSLAPNLERVISGLVKYDHTKSTAAALQTWLIEHKSELADISKSTSI